MEATPLPTLDGLPSAVAAACDHSGRYTLNSVACSVDAVVSNGHLCEAGPFQWLQGVTESTNDKKHSVNRLEISKMKGQGLNCITNASLMSVNLRYIAYALKEGVVRIISRNGKEMFKMSNISKAPIADIATLGTDNKGQGANFLVCLDNAGHALVYDMDAEKAWVMIFPEADAPLFVRAHPSEPDLFVTVCKRYLTVWSLRKLLAAEQSPPPAEMQRKPAEDYGFRMVTDDLLLSCGSRAVLPALLPRCLPDWLTVVFTHSLAQAQILDAAVSVSGEFLCALYGEHIITWRLVASSIGVEPELQPIQLTSLPQASGICSIRILGNGGLAQQGGCPMPGSHEVLVVGSNNGRDLAVYELSPESPANPIGALLQSIHVDSSSESVSLSVNTITQDSLVLAFQADQFVLVLPLAAGWANGPNCPFPFVQQVRCDESAHQLSVMTGKSFFTSGHTLFVYRAHNFTREKDGLMGCNVVVDEVKGELIARSEPIASSVAAGASAMGAAASSVNSDSVSPSPQKKGNSDDGSSHGSSDEEVLMCGCTGQRSSFQVQSAVASGQPQFSMAAMAAGGLIPQILPPVRPIVPPTLPVLPPISASSSSSSAPAMSVTPAAAAGATPPPRPVEPLPEPEQPEEAHAEFGRALKRRRTDTD